MLHQIDGCYTYPQVSLVPCQLDEFKSNTSVFMVTFSSSDRWQEAFRTELGKCKESMYCVHKRPSLNTVLSLSSYKMRNLNDVFNCVQRRLYH
jgi:hypothetical protein